MTQARRKPAQQNRIGQPPGTRDRFSLTLMLSLAAHVMVILGVGVAAPELLKNRSAASLDVTLVMPKEPEPAPEKADYLAQISQAGGGEEAAKALPTTPVPAKQANPADDAPVQLAAAPPVEVTPPAPQPELTLTESERKTETPAKAPEAPIAPPATDLMRISREIARLDAQRAEFLVNYAKTPRRKVVTAATREYAYAQYLEAWRQKAERFGNLNYPVEARRKRLYGQLRLLVELTPDGGVNRIELRQSSGHPELDEAATRIVELAAPYAPFPDDIRAETDLLVIIRTWQFMPGDRLSSR
ncbi:MAG: TonB family protein [Gammaproteobacteria bacterium]|nr:TonB family protein [Gammaproteobacteria bacterium]